MIVIRAVFEGKPHKHYNYLCPFTNVKVGDKVIVESPYNGYTAVEVVGIHNVGDAAAGSPGKEVVCTIDDRDYLVRKRDRERLNEINKATKELAEANARLERLREETTAVAAMVRDRRRFLEQVQAKQVGGTPWLNGVFQRNPLLGS